MIASAAATLMAAGFIFVAALAALAGVSLSAGHEYPSADPGTGVSTLASRDIPPAYLRLYEQAGRRFGLDWAILAGIGRVECDHGRDPDPSCRKEGAVNAAGAGGPMQFLAATWSAYGVDGDGDGKVNRWDPADAIFAAANYLRGSGAPANYHRAILSYNKAEWYVRDVMSWAARYRGPDVSTRGPAAGIGPGSRLEGTSPTPVRFIAGEHAILAPGDGHLALVPLGAPVVVQAMVVAGNELQELPYGPEGHPDPRGASQEDCSSTVNYILYRSGVRPIAEILRDNPLAQDYTHWGSPGPGRWVTIYAATSPTDHVFITVAGLRLDTSHRGTDTGPNRTEDGPRWRIMPGIPTWARWAVRHPPGL